MDRLWGHYADGVAAARYRVTLALTPEGLEIAGADGGVIAIWPLPHVRLIDDLGDGGVRLTSETAPESRLTVTDPATVAHLREQLVNIRRGRVAAGRIGRGIGWSAACLAFLAAAYVALPYAVEPAVTLVPIEWEEKMGADVVRQLSEFLSTNEPAICDDPAGVAALGSVTRRLTAGMESPYTYRVSVANSSLVNAFATLGGHVVLLRGLIEKAETPDEITGVLAHEIAHVSARHPTKGLIREMGVSLIFSTLLGSALSFSPGAGELGTVLISLSYSRADEAQADAMAVEILDAANLRTGGLAAFFERLREADKDGFKIPAILSTHPQAEDRIPAPPPDEASRGSGFTDREWKAVKAICGAPEEKKAD